jgi:hypothetical protein
METPLFRKPVFNLSETYFVVKLLFVPCDGNGRQLFRHPSQTFCNDSCLFKFPSHTYLRFKMFWEIITVSSTLGSCRSWFGGPMQLHNLSAAFRIQHMRKNSMTLCFPSYFFCLPKHSLLLWNLKFRHRAHKIWPLDQKVSQINPMPYAISLTFISVFILPSTSTGYPIRLNL